MIRIKSLISQIVLVIFCAFILVKWALHFPYPSPMVHDLLPPQKRWPTQQVADWVLSDNIDEGFMSFFYRDPDRTVPNGNNMVAPADGKVLEIIEANGIKHIVIALTFWDVHVQRSPADGIVQKVEAAGDTLMDGEGRNLVFLEEKQSPVQKVVHIKTDWGLIKVRLITSLLARRIEVWLKEGDRVSKGQRLGLIHLGSTVVVDVPENFEPLVKVGERVIAGETIMFNRGSK